MSEETENPAQDLREVSPSWGNRLANCLMALAVLALMGAGVREYLIHNGKLTSDLNANGFAITNLPAGFIPDVGAAIGDFARTNGVLSRGPYVQKTSTSPSGQSMYGGFRIRGWLDTTGTVSATCGGPTPLGMRMPSAWMDCGSFNLGWATGGWTFDSEGFHRHLHGAVFEPFTNGPAIRFPEDAWETGGTLALRSDLAATDLSAASNYTDAALGTFAATGRVAYAANAGYSDVAQAASVSTDATVAQSLFVEEFRDPPTITALELIAETARKQDALPYPTNAIPYAAISGAPSGAPEWEEKSIVIPDPIRFVTNGMLQVTFDRMDAEVETNGWPNGAAMFVAGRVYQEYTMPDYVCLVGYGTWPTNDFQSVWWRSGTNIFVNILLEE